VGVVLLLIVAGTIEGFISPLPIDPRIKYSIAAITGVALYSYLLFIGHGTQITEGRVPSPADTSPTKPAPVLPQ